MGLGDRLRAWLRGEETGPGPSGGAGSGRASRKRGRAAHPAAQLDAPELEEFLRTRHGVELYLEPRTRLYGESVLLVADDGEYLRRPVPDAASARRWAGAHGIPVYDAARTGYPRRVRDYDRGVRSERIGLEDLPPWPGSGPEDGETEPPPPPTEQAG